jgi:uncharacterized protein
MQLRRFAWLMVFALAPAVAEAQSFNCRYARSPDEVMICQSPQLAALDERMSGLYFRLRNSLVGRERARLEADQAAWLGSRQACGRDAGCIAASYRQRIAELRSY